MNNTELTRLRCLVEEAKHLSRVSSVLFMVTGKPGFGADAKLYPTGFDTGFENSNQNLVWIRLVDLGVLTGFETQTKFRPDSNPWSESRLMVKQRIQYRGSTTLHPKGAFFSPLVPFLPLLLSFWLFWARFGPHFGSLRVSKTWLTWLRRNGKRYLTMLIPSRCILTHLWEKFSLLVLLSRFW